jgi:hypothetical protein
MRTFVRMTARPWKPAVELEGALARGDLKYATTLAAEVAEDRGRPIDLDAALRFLPLVAVREPCQYDAWALRWLRRWIAETPEASIELAAEVSGMLADLRSEPTVFKSLRQAYRVRHV